MRAYMSGSSRIHKKEHGHRRGTGALTMARRRPCGREEHRRGCLATSVADFQREPADKSIYDTYLFDSCRSFTAFVAAQLQTQDRYR